MAQVGPLRMCLVPDVVSPHAVFLSLAILGVLHHGHSVVFVRIFETVHCFRPLYDHGIWIRNLVYRSKEPKSSQNVTYPEHSIVLPYR